MTTSTICPPRSSTAGVDLVAAARAAARRSRPVHIALPAGSGWRTYLPRPYGSYFDTTQVTAVEDAAALLAIAEQLLVDGAGDQARAALAYIDIEGLRMDVEQRSTQTRLHQATHLYACCVLHGTHTIPHRSCILR